MKLRSIQWSTTVYLLTFLILTNTLYYLSIFYSVKHNVYELAAEQIKVTTKTMVQSTLQVIDIQKATAQLEATHINEHGISKIHEFDEEGYFLQNPNINWFGLFQLQKSGQLKSITELYSKTRYAMPKDYSFHPGDFFRSMENIYSGHIISPVTGEHVVWLLTPQDSASKIQTYLVTEIALKTLSPICTHLKFGVHGHCVIVDYNGVVISHPNPDWIKERRNISSWPAIHAGLTMNEGMTSFFSPFFKQDMIAGYAPVGDYGWYILLPQPQGELDEKVLSVFITNAPAYAISLVVSLIFAIWLSKRFSTPIVRLAEKTRKITDPSLLETTSFNVTKEDPLEVAEFKNNFSLLINNIRESQFIFENTIDHSPIFMLLFSDTGEISLAIGRKLSLIGYSEATSRTVQSLFKDKLDFEQLKRKLSAQTDVYDNLRINASVIDIFATIVDFTGPQNRQYILIGVDVSDSWLSVQRNLLLDLNSILLQQSYASAEKERQILSRELHDVFSQNLTGIRNLVSHVLDLLARSPSLGSHVSSDDTVNQHLTSVVDITDDLQSVINGMLKRLWPEELEELGLCAPIEKLASDFRASNPNVEVNVTCSVNQEDSDFEHLLVAYRIIQESLTNAARHSNASRLEIKAEIIIIGETPKICISVFDNGVGFDYEKEMYTSKGLITMRERVAAYHGQLTVKSNVNKGCQIQAYLPLRSPTHRMTKNSDNANQSL